MSTRVGIREAKIHLTRYLKLVKSGKEVVLTERGRPIGKIVPIQKQALLLDERIKRLEDAGILERRTGPRRLPPPVSIPGLSPQEILRRDREG